MRRGFTLIELLVVIVVIVIISVIALPVVLPALRHRQVSEGARVLQGSLVGSRDAALQSNSPSGIRLLPDPAFPLVYLPNGQIDPNQPLVANRIIPIAPAPNYSEGRISRVDTSTLPAGFTMPYPALMVCEQLVGTTGELNSPTSWFWNIRVGDKIQIDHAGPWYTVVGPMFQGPAQGNSELFVNVGIAGITSPFAQIQFGQTVNPEFLWLVDGRDDNDNGWADEGFDGLDNNADGNIDELAEWELESWQGAAFPSGSIYEIARRPAPLSNSREVSLPTHVVIDLTTWATTKERSRLPVDPRTGFVDLLVNPNGSVSFASQYGVPSSVAMDAGKLFFWLAERHDVAQPLATVPALAVGEFLPAVRSTPYAGPILDGEYTIVSLATRTGQIESTTNPGFDNPAQPIGALHASYYVQPLPAGLLNYQPGIPFGIGLR